MQWHDYNKAVLAITAWREARGDGREAMRGVMHVIRNRVLTPSGEFGKVHDWDHVIAGRLQFSSMTALGDSQTILWPKEPDALFELAMQLADGVYGTDGTDGTDVDITGGSAWYANLAVLKPRCWFFDNIAAKPADHPHVCKIVNHDYYL